MRIAIVAPTAWRTPQAHETPTNQAALLTEGLVKRGDEVSMFSVSGQGPHSISGNEFDPDTASLQACMDISEVLEFAESFDIIHNHCGALPLTCAGLTTRLVLTTLYSTPSSQGLSIFRKRSLRSWYVAAGDSVRSPELTYAATIHPAIDATAVPFVESHGGYLVTCCEIRPENGVDDAAEIAARSGMPLVMMGPIGDRTYFNERIAPRVDRDRITYVADGNPGDRAHLIGKAAGLLCPIRETSSFPLATVEANAFGTPAIAYPVRAMRELVIDGRNGFLVPDVEAAVRAVGRLNSLSRKEVRATVEERFSPDVMVAAYQSLYVEMLKSANTEDHRPWGYYQVLTDQADHKVKRIVVYPGKRLSLQRHKLRSEHWTIVSGGPVVVVNDTVVKLKPGDAIEIPVGASHRIENPGKGPVVFIEVQTGDYFGEDDIERFEDDFGRIGQSVR